MFTKTQTMIMECFASTITEKYSINQIATLLKKPYPLIHRSIQQLIKDRLIIKDERGLLSLHSKDNQQQIAYIESLRTKEFLQKNKVLQLFVNDVFSKVKLNFFILLVFGSSVKKKKKPNDIDILFIVENKKNIDNIEQLLENISSNLSITFDIQVISTESVYEMIIKRDQINVMNETLNNHIIIFGAENYYRLINNARQ